MIAHRPFETYESYVYHQGGKARGRREHLMAHLDRHIQSYAKMFRKAAPHLKPGPILCLGARTGAESLGATLAGFTKSVGIDLHPVGPTVLQGDWHDLQFPEKSFSNVYCNSLDHCLHLDKLTAHVKRVLTKHGRFYVMATNREGATLEAWQKAWSKSNEALYWQTSDELRDAICAFGFTTVQSWRDGKWGHYILGVS